MALNGKFILNGADISPLIFPGVGTFMAFSGSGAYLNHPGCSMYPSQGPVPPGRYWIVDRPQGRLISYSRLNEVSRDLVNKHIYGAQFRHSEWFALYPEAWGNVNDGMWIQDVWRGHFRLHPGRISQGCITLMHDTDYRLLRNALLRTAKFPVTCMKDMMAYGQIEVIANDYINANTCP